MSVDALFDAELIDSLHASHVDYSARATDPGPGYPAPLPGTHLFQSVRGRSGDLIVVQLKSANGLKPNRRAALQSLGLRGPHSAILRHSSDSSLWGNVEAVRDIIAVIILPREEFAVGADVRSEDEHATHESLKYGTDTRPGHLWRNDQGDYFASEFEKSTLVAFWSSDCSMLTELLDGLKPSGLDIDTTASAALRVAVPGKTTLERRCGGWHDLVREIGNAVVAEALIPVQNGTQVVWRKSLKRFHDTDVYRPAITVVSKPADILATRSLAQITCADGFLESVPCRLITRVHGALREYPVEPKPA